MRPKKTPSPLLLKHAAFLFEEGIEREAFIEALLEGNSKESAILMMEDRPEVKAFPKLGPLPWQPTWVHRLHESFRPGKHPLYAKGAYYSLDFSSVFSASAILSISDPKPRWVLDLCASPGGKSIFAWKAFNPEVLACNETVRKRSGTLIANLERCRIARSLVWSADPSVWAKRFPECFDLVLVDAPCSGQSLLAKGSDAVGCFTPQMIDMCVGRQRRIVGNAVRCLRPGGHLLYSTCTYTHKENEKVIAWLLETDPALEAVEVPHLHSFQSRFSSFPSYRLFPQQGLGAGAFVALVSRNGEQPVDPPDLSDLKPLWVYGQTPPVARAPHTPEPSEPLVTAKPRLVKKRIRIPLQKPKRGR